MTVTALRSGRGALADFGRAARAEWTKFRTLRSSLWTLVAAGVLTVGIGTAFLPVLARGHDGPAGRAAKDAVAEGWWFNGLHVGILAMVILGVLAATAEYTTGTIRASLAAVPSRTRVLTAKAACLVAVALAAGGVQAVAVVLAAHPVLAARGIDISLAQSGVWTCAARATLAMTAAALFGLAAGLLIRHTAGAVGAVTAVLWVLSELGLLLPDSLNWLQRLMPANALGGMYTAGWEYYPSPGPATALFLGYTAALWAIAAALFVRRDA